MSVLSHRAEPSVAAQPSLKDFRQAAAAWFRKGLGVMTALAILATLTVATIGARFVLWMPPIPD